MSRDYDERPWQVRGEEDYVFAERLAAWERRAAFKRLHRLSERAPYRPAVRRLLASAPIWASLNRNVRALGLEFKWCIPGAFLDHPRMYGRRGFGHQPVLLLGSPYGLTKEDVETIGRIRASGLVVEIREDLNLYSHRTIDVLIWARGHEPARTPIRPPSGSATRQGEARGLPGPVGRATVPGRGQ